MAIVKINKYETGKKILEQIKKINKTIPELSILLGISESSLRRYEKGLVLPKLSFFVKLANITNIEIDELISFEIVEK